MLAPLIAMFLIFAINGDISGTIWVLYSTEKFGWDQLTMGFSLAVFGLFAAFTQAFLTGTDHASGWASSGRSSLPSLPTAVAFIAIGLATAGWAPFVLAPLFALGGIGHPALQSLMSAQVGEDRQGELQGVLASAREPDLDCRAADRHDRLFLDQVDLHRHGLAGRRRALPAGDSGAGLGRRVQARQGRQPECAPAHQRQARNAVIVPPLVWLGLQRPMRTNIEQCPAGA